MRNKAYTRNYPCYKSKIRYHMNRVNNLVNCAPYQRDPDLLIRHMESLKHFVNKQAELQQKELDAERACNFYNQPGNHQ